MKRFGHESVYRQTDTHTDGKTAPIPWPQPVTREVTKRTEIILHVADQWIGVPAILKLVYFDRKGIIDSVLILQAVFLHPWLREEVRFSVPSICPYVPSVWVQ